MNYQKITKEVEVNTRGGATATGGSLSIGDLERHGTIYADKLVPFHAVDTAVVDVSTESASRPDPYGCEEGGEEMICENVSYDASASFITSGAPQGYVVAQRTISGYQSDIDCIAVTIDGARTELPKQEAPFEGVEYFSVEPYSETPGNPSVIRSQNEGYNYVSIYAKAEDVSAGTHELAVEFCTKA